jgi:uncharacterized protein YcgI (DUF1989 family)
MTNEFIVESGGFTFEVPSSHYFKFELLEGQQILDVAIWTKDNPKNEFLSMHHTMFMNGRKVTKGYDLWSDYVERKIIAKCVDETEYESSSQGYFHHGVMGYCDYTETKRDVSCKTNFLNSIKEFGLGVEHLNDNTINLFDKFRCNPDGYLVNYPSDAVKGDYITFMSAESLLVSVSLCPITTNWKDLQQRQIAASVKKIKVSIYE